MTDAKFAQVAVDEIHVAGNVRRRFDEEKLAELAASIREYGIIEPLIVRVDPDVPAARHELVAGERRLRAAKIAGLERVPVRVMTLTREQAAKIQLIENLQRQDLDPIEEASGFRALIDEHGYTQEALAADLGVSQPHIANRLALLRLPEEVQENISRGMISATAGRELLRLERWPKLLAGVAEEIIEAGVSTRAIPMRIDQCAENHGRNITKDAHWPYPRPAFDVSGCKGCDDQWRGRGSGKYLCMNHHCWGQKQAKAQREIKAQEKAGRQQQAPESPAVAGAPAARDLDDHLAKVAAAQAAESVADKVKAMLTKAGPGAPAIEYANYDPVKALANKLRDAVLQYPYSDRLWGQEHKGDYSRECFLSLKQLIQHFTDRHKLGASVMPAHWGTASIIVPEQGFECHGEDGSMVILRDNGIEFRTSGGSVIDSWAKPESMVYYRVTITHLARAQVAFCQWMAVRGRSFGDRMIVIRACASVTAQRDIKVKWLKLINSLPAFLGEGVDLPAQGKRSGAANSDQPEDDARRCRVCGCTDDDCSQCVERTGAPCSWVEEDLCSACEDAEILAGDDDDDMAETA